MLQPYLMTFKANTTDDLPSCTDLSFSTLMNVLNDALLKIHYENILSQDGPKPKC